MLFIHVDFHLKVVFWTYAVAFRFISGHFTLAQPLGVLLLLLLLLSPRQLLHLKK